MIHVIATIQLQPGARPAFAREFSRIVPLVRAEHGCRYYGGAIDVPTGNTAQAPTRPDVFVVVEQWDSLDALQAHSVSSHMVAWRDRVRPHMVRTTIQVLEPAGEPA